MRVNVSSTTLNLARELHIAHGVSGSYGEHNSHAQRLSPRGSDPRKVSEWYGRQKSHANAWRRKQRLRSQASFDGSRVEHSLWSFCQDPPRPISDVQQKERPERAIVRAQGENISEWMASKHILEAVKGWDDGRRQRGTIAVANVLAAMQ
jgi:hypothetical protein